MLALVFIVTILTASAKAQDIKAGLNCKTQGEFTYCEGDSTVYNNSVINAIGLLNREHDDRFNKNYGVRSPLQCDNSFGSRCQQVGANILPTYLMNNQDQPRYILQEAAFKQPVSLNVCSGKVCGQYGFCEQDYINVQLLCWDPFSDRPTLLVDNFKIPSCCKCRRGGSRPGIGGPRWE